MTALRRFTWWWLGVALAFGILTLWIRAMWPFVVFQAAVLGMAGVWFGVAAWKGGARLSAWLCLPFGVVGIGAAQLAFGFSEQAWQTRAAMLEWVTYGCAAVLAFVVSRDPVLRVRGLRVFALGAGALALLSTLQNYSAPGKVLWLWTSRYSDMVFGPFEYHTKLAVFAELGIAAAVWLAVTERRSRGLYAVAAVALAGSVVASASRGGMLVLALELLVLGVVAGRGALRGRGWRASLVFVGALAVGVAAFGWELAALRFETSDPLRDLRLPLMASAADMGGRYWATGAGLGTWATVYPEFARFDLHIRVNQAHTDWLQWLGEGGLAWPLLMLAMGVASVWRARAEWWMLGFVFVLVHCVGDYPMQQTPALTGLVMTFWGAGLAVGRRGVRLDTRVVQVEAVVSSAS